MQNKYRLVAPEASSLCLTTVFPENRFHVTEYRRRKVHPSDSHRLPPTYAWALLFLWPGREQVIQDPSGKYLPRSYGRS